MAEVKTKGKGRIFNNPVLEALTKTHPALIIGMYVPLSVVSVIYFYNTFYPSLWLTASLFVSGVLLWTLVEYLLHRYIFHFITESAVVQRFHYTVHVAGFFFGLYYAVMGSYVYAFLPGFVIGYLVYASIHYAIHAHKPPKGLEYLWRHHNLHHFKYPDRAFGVSSPLWDMIFGTMPPKSSQK